MTNAKATTLHRRLDDAAAEAMSRDDGELIGRDGALMRPRDRRKDMQTMQRPKTPKVLLLTLSERTSATGNRYVSGWLGKARLVGFLADEPDAHGNPQWNVYAAEPESRPKGEGQR